MKYKATPKFKTLGIENSYQNLETDDYYALRAGNEVGIDNFPAFLLENKYVEIVKEHKKGGL